MKMNFKSTVLAIGLLVAGVIHANASDAAQSGDQTTGTNTDPSMVLAPTPYNDGRKTEVRVFNYYDFYRDKSIVAGAPDPKLLLMVVEWDRYNAVVSDDDGAFAQLKINAMIGGDVETNKKTSPFASQFFKIADAVFITQRSAINKISSIPNRDVEMVSFDFVTNQGTFTLQQKRSDLENVASDWGKLFKSAQVLHLKFENLGQL
jgi:hypothetical protein